MDLFSTLAFFIVFTPMALALGLVTDLAVQKKQELDRIRRKDRP